MYMKKAFTFEVTDSVLTLIKISYDSWFKGA